MRSYVGLAAVASAFLVAPPALAADWFPVYSTYDDGIWNKLYVGAHAGAAWGDSDWPYALASPGFDTGTVFGGQVGILHQFGPLVAGAEVSYSGLNDVEGTSLCWGGGYSCSNSIDNLLLVNGRLGYAFGPLLLYGTGGYARAELDLEDKHLSSPRDWRNSSDVSGWNVGGGIEFQFTRNVSLAVQYVHVNLDSDNYRMTDVSILGAPAYTERVENPELDIVEARLNILLDTRRNYEPPIPLK